MSYRKATLLVFTAALLAAPPFAAQQKGRSSWCMLEYENHNQIDYSPLIIEEIEGTITDPQQAALPRACVGIFTEKEHKLIATTESDADGRFSLQNLPPGRYRLVVKADPLCAANVPLEVVKHQKKKKVLQVHMKPRGLDSCSYGEAIQASVQSAPEGQGGAQETQIRDYCIDPSTGLMWARKDNGKDVSWNKAMKYCRDLRQAGYSDWRLATLGELEGIYDKDANAPGLAGPPKKPRTFTFHVKGNLFLTGDQWSSIRLVDDRGHPSGYAPRFDFNEGRVFNGDELSFSTNKRALCVRGSGK